MDIAFKYTVSVYLMQCIRIFWRGVYPEKSLNIENFCLIFSDIFINQKSSFFDIGIPLSWFLLQEPDLNKQIN